MATMTESTDVGTRGRIIGRGAAVGIALAGAGSTVVLVLNGLKRAGVIEDSTLLQIVAPLGALLAIPVLVAVASVAGAGRLSELPAVLGLATTVAGEYALNGVFPYVTPDVRGSLLEGSLGTLLTGGAVIFLVGMAVYAAALWRTAVPRTALVALVLGAALIALRSVLPPIAVPVGVWVLGGVTLGLTVWVCRRSVERG